MDALSTNPNLPIVLAQTGASGAIYAVRLLGVLVAAGRRVQLTISPAAREVLQMELELSVDLDAQRFDAVGYLRDGQRRLESRGFRPAHQVVVPPASTAAALPPTTSAPSISYSHYRDFLAPMASGSARTAGMVVCPCSGGSLSAIAHASSNNLIHRAADVHLKEGRRLILVPRETPLSLIQIDNLRRCAEAGALLLPAMPGFYHHAQTLADLVDFVVARICDHLGVEHRLTERWGERTSEA